MREDGEAGGPVRCARNPCRGGVGVFCRLGPKSLPTLIAELRAQDRAGQGGRAAGQGSSSWAGHCWTSGADGGADQGRVGAVVMVVVVVVVGGVPVGVLRACGPEMCLLSWSCWRFARWASQTLTSRQAGYSTVLYC
jgi:hypothetical protein